MFAYECVQIVENDVDLFSLTQGNVVIQGGYPVYIVNNSGCTEGGNRVVEGEITERPEFKRLARFYPKAPVKSRGSTTHIEGMDRCGSVNMPGIITTTSTVTEKDS